MKPTRPRSPAPLAACLIVGLSAGCTLGGPPKPAPTAAPPQAAPDAEDASTMQAASTAASTAARTARDTAVRGIPQAASAPLEDLNVRRDPVPEPLADIHYVYETGRAPACWEIAAELDRLAPVLGRDYDEEAQARSLGEQGGETAGDFLIDTIRSAATGWIPFRGVVRQASGAESHARMIARAYTAGHARRAYLKGLAAGSGCAPPVAPLRYHAPDREPAIEMRETREGPDRRWGAPEAETTSED